MALGEHGIEAAGILEETGTKETTHAKSHPQATIPFILLIEMTTPESEVVVAANENEPAPLRDPPEPALLPVPESVSIRCIPMHTGVLNRW